MVRKAVSAPVGGVEFANAGIHEGSVWGMVKHALPWLKLGRQLLLVSLHYLLTQRHHVLAPLRTCAHTVAFAKGTEGIFMAALAT
jgi:hypothetical protein